MTPPAVMATAKIRPSFPSRNGGRPEASRCQQQKLKSQRAYDNDSGMAMLRIGSMNLMLHGIEHPAFFYMDTLAKAFVESGVYDVLLMNPPFKGAVDKDDVNPTLPSGVTSRSCSLCT